MEAVFWIQIADLIVAFVQTDFATEAVDVVGVAAGVDLVAADFFPLL